MNEEVDRSGNNNELNRNRTSITPNVSRERETKYKRQTTKPYVTVIVFSIWQKNNANSI